MFIPFPGRVSRADEDCSGTISGAPSLRRAHQESDALGAVVGADSDIGLGLLADVDHQLDKGLAQTFAQIAL